MLFKLLRQVNRTRASASGAALLRLPERALQRLAETSGDPNIGGAVVRLQAEAPAAVVIVPIHNAPEELDLCLAALTRHTPVGTRLILIDDASADPRVGAVLARYSAVAGLEIHRNTANLGFTRTVNRGMELAGRADVVLLNSDTEVTPRWLHNLRLAAYSGPRVGTATPFSDNAGAFSAPQPNRPNPLPEGLDLDSYARLVTQASKRRYPQIATGHGFCLYIRRACLDDVGAFDADAFPLGYGEENDFCMRAGRFGWAHVVDDATLIRHVRSASFGAARAELLQSSGRLLAERFPDYPGRVRAIGRNRALKAARADLAAAAAEVQHSRRPVLPRALFVIGTTVGGTPQTNRDLMTALSGRFDTLVLHSDARHVTLSRFVEGREERLERVRLARPLRPFPHTDDAYDQMVAGWLSRYAVELVHVRHLVWHSLNLPRLARALGIPVVFSFHDFYAICPTVRLVDESDVFCGGDCTPGPGPCRQALWKAADMPPLKHAAVHDWRRAMSEMLESCDAFVTTSEDTRERIRRFFPATAAKPFPLIEHGRDFPAFQRLGRFPGGGARARILVPGNLSTTKGARVLQALQRLDGVGRLEFHVLGKVSRELKAGPGLVLHGPYERGRFAELVASIAPNFGAVLSIWPETYCHTLTEMWAAGLPVAAFDMGAVGERIRRHGGGWLIAPVTPEAAHAAFTAILFDPADFEAKLAEVGVWQDGAGAAENCARMADRYAGLYGSLMNAGREASA